MADLIGVVSGVIGIVSPTINQIEQLVDRCQNFRAAPAEFRDLRKDCNAVRDLLQSLKRDLEQNASAIPDDIQRFNSEADTVKRNFKDAEDRCHVVEKYLLTPESDASSCYGWFSRLRQALARFFFAGIISRECQHIASTVRDANTDGTELNRFLHMSVQIKSVRTDVSVVKRNTDTILQITEEIATDAKDVFKRDYYVPDLSQKILLDFSTCDAEGVPITSEGKVKRALLQVDSHVQFSRIAVAVGAGGMGGVGKTNALLGLGWDSDVRERFKNGGIYFLSFGKDASLGDVIEQLALAVEVSGGVRRSNEIRGSKTLSRAIVKVVSWFEERETLFLCDDIWETAESSVGYFKDLKQLLTSRGRSRMVLSTRDQHIADAAGMPIEFGPRNPEGNLSRAILLKYVGISEEEVSTRSCEECSEAIRKILCSCGGVPLTLGVAGQAIRTTIRTATNSSNCDDGLQTAILIYAEKLETSSQEMIITEDIEGYPNFCATVRTSLDMVDEWAQKKGIGGKTTKVVVCSDLFTRMNVFPRGSMVPQSAVKILWGVAHDHVVNQIIDKLFNLNLLSKREDRKKGVSVGLHDLVREYCVIQAGRDTRSYHRDFLSHYLTSNSHLLAKNAAVGDKELRKLSNVVESRPWWSLSSDGYFPDNVCWHLWKAGCVGELVALLCDVRWTMFRMRSGGLLGWRSDFESMKNLVSETKKESPAEDEWELVELGVRLVGEAVNEAWVYLNGNERELGMQVHSRLFDVDEEVWPVRRYLESVRVHCEKPLLLPLGRYWPRPGMGANVELLVGVDVESFAMTTDGSVVAGAEGTEVLIIDVESRSILKRLVGHRGAVTSVCISGNGSLIASGSKDGTLRRWDGRTGAALGEPLCGHDGMVICVAMSEDGALIVSGSTDGTLRRWDGRTGAVMGEALRGHHNWVHCVAVNGDGTVIVSWGEDGTVRRWDGKTGAAIGDPLYECCNGVRCLAISHDGSMIVSGLKGALRRWDARTGAAIDEPLCGHDGDVSCVAMSRDGALIVSGSIDGTLRRWDGNTGEAMGEPLHGNTGLMLCVAVSGDGAMIVSRSLDMTLCLWDGRTGAFMGNSLRKHVDHASCVAMSGDGAMIVFGTEDGTLRRWNGRIGMAMGEQLRGHEDQVDYIAISTDGAVMVSASDTTVRLWDARTGTAIGPPVLSPNLESIQIETDFVTARVFLSKFKRWKIDLTCGLVQEEEWDCRAGWPDCAVRSEARDASPLWELRESSHQLIWHSSTGVQVLATLLSPVSMVEYKRVSFLAGGIGDDDEESSYTVGAVVAVILRNRMLCVFHLVMK